MERSIFFEIIKNWFLFTERDKKELLQEFEKQNSKLQSRPERNIVFYEPTENFETCLGFYNITDRSCINVFPANISKCPESLQALVMLDTIFHEGTHAMVDDALEPNGRFKTSTKFNLGNMEKFKLVSETILYTNLKKILTNDQISLLMSYCPEESLVRRETIMFLVYNIIKETKNDLDLQDKFFHYSSLICDYKSFLKDKNEHSAVYNTLFSNVENVILESNTRFAFKLKDLNHKIENYKNGDYEEGLNFEHKADKINYFSKSGKIKINNVLANLINDDIKEYDPDYKNRFQKAVELVNEF